jgi:hypothetical protein
MDVRLTSLHRKALLTAALYWQAMVGEDPILQEAINWLVEAEKAQAHDDHLTSATSSSNT